MKESTIKAEQTLKNFMHTYLVERNKENTMSYLWDNAYSIGTGISEFAFNKKEFGELLDSELSNDSEPFCYEFLKLLVQPVNEGTFSFCAEISIHKERGTEEETISITPRFTGGLVRMEDGEYKIFALHMSMPMQEQEDYEFYPITFGDKTISQLREEFQEGSFQLMKNIIPGGMMGGYIEPGFPFYFVNDEMLEYLGFEHDEFIEAIDGLITNCMHPEDRKYVDSVVEESLMYSDEYEVTYRMRKKDNSYIWVKDKGRRIIAENGKPAIMSVCMDITNMIDLQCEIQQKVYEVARKNQEIEYFYNTVFSGVAKITADSSCRVIKANKRFYDMLGYTEKEFMELSRKPGFRAVLDKDFSQILKLMSEVTPEKPNFTYNLPFIRKDGSNVWIRLDVRLSDEMYKGSRVLYCIYTNIDEQREQEIEIQKQSYFTSLVLKNNTVGMMIVNCDDNCTFAYVGDNLISFLGYEKDEFYKKVKNYVEICYPDDIPSLRRNIELQLENCNYYEVEYRVQKKDNSVIWVLEKGNREFDEDGNEIRICVLLDHSQQKNTRDRLLRESRMEPLTQLLNRNAAREAIEEHLDFQKKKGCSALFLLDLDNFKLINDRFGHMEGDAVLIEVANILCNSFRSTDVVARLGGDEFIVYMKEVDRASDVDLKAQYACTLFRKRFHRHYENTNLTVSIGVISIDWKNNENAPTFEQLYKEADAALYRAKCNGKNTYEVFEL